MSLEQRLRRAELQLERLTKQINRQQAGVIEQGIEPPQPEHHNGEHSAIYINMRVKDSVFIDKASSVRSCAFYRNAAAYGRRTGKSFTGRKEGNGVRVWRVK